MNSKKYPFWYVGQHVLILGAGASCAAFPKGDKYGRVLPTMDNFVEVLELEPFLRENNINHDGKNIEDIYNDIYETDSDNPILNELNRMISEYFSELELPDEVTLYDRLILSLQKKDVIFSFNWDPLLLQAFHRNESIAELPKIHFLHGNVGVGVCNEDKRCGYIGNSCSKCGEQFSPCRLLYPIQKKNYNQEPFIAAEWIALEAALDNSFILTIFGYSAPKTDIEAREIMQKAWKKNMRHELNEIEIIDIQPKDKINENWADFIHKSHSRVLDDASNCFSFKYARRSCNAWGDAIMQCEPWRERSIPTDMNLSDLHDWIQPLVDEEIEFQERDVVIPQYRG